MNEEEEGSNVPKSIDEKKNSLEPPSNPQQCDLLPEINLPQLDEHKEPGHESQPPLVITDESGVIGEEEEGAPSVVGEEPKIVAEDETPSVITKESPPPPVSDEPELLAPVVVESEKEKEKEKSESPCTVSDEPDVVVGEAVFEEAPSTAVADETEGVVVEKTLEDDVISEEAPSVPVNEAELVVEEAEAPLTVSDATRDVVGQAFTEEAHLTVADVPEVVVEPDDVIDDEASSMAVDEPEVAVREEDLTEEGEEAAPSIVLDKPVFIGEEGTLGEAVEITEATTTAMVADKGEESSLMVEDKIEEVVDDAPSAVAEETASIVEEVPTSIVPEEANVVMAEEVAAEAVMETEMETEEEVALETEMETEENEATEAKKSGGKRKRGRPPKNQSQTKAPPPPPPPKKTIEEDVCFICFDGGEIVLCDRRGCPKAYHPACINRDAAFFRSKGRWTCGWHICSDCEKAAHYMCYTCTYSLCKGCIKETEFFCVRGNKGFCETCRRTVMLIEENEQGNKEKPKIDFDDKSSWEYLFKDYWLDLKQKLSLTSDELLQARNPWKESNALARKEESSEELYDANDDQSSDSDSSSGHLELSNSKKRRGKSQSKSSKEEISSSVTQAVGSEETSTSNDVEWASAELLEFVAHMKNGDKSFISQYDVQALLLEYIKRNNLRDPRKKSQIVCDSRLTNLFGKARVGHFEMLKLLENHFHVKEDAPPDDIQVGNVNTDANQLEVDGSGFLKKDKRRKTRRKGDEREPQTNLDDYAAIDVHNIRLLYLRRSLLEDLLEDSDMFHDKVVGSFVRIRISGSGLKQDMYRLVQVIGTRKAQEPYKTGKRSTDIVLEILNLNKTEVLSIDTISNQEFSEDECKRLRQSIKCGLISRMTVGEVQEKAMTLHTVRANDSLEAEKLRITHLRDRASEQGRRKELRECVEKLQLLNTPEERSRRLHEIPEVHADPNMDPNYESEEDEEPEDKQQDNYMRPRDTGFSRKGREAISPGKVTASEPGRNMSTKGSWGKGESSDERSNEFSWSQRKDVNQSNSYEKQKNQAPTTGFDADGWTGKLVTGPSSVVVADTALGSNPTGAGLSTNFNETDKTWHYKDPSGKIQGPFSMVQLRKWSTTGYFPPDLRIWRTTEKQEDSILLSDALKGKFSKELPQIGNNVATWTDKIQIDGSWNSNGNDSNHAANGNIKVVNGDGWGSGSSGWTASKTDPRRELSGYSSRGWDSSKGNTAWSAQSQVHSPHQSSSFSGQPHRQLSQQGGQSGGRWNHGRNHGNSWNTNRSPGFQSNTGAYERRTNNWDSSAQARDNRRSQPELSSTKGWSTPSVETPKFTAEGWGADQNNRNTSSSLPSPTPTRNVSWQSETALDGRNDFVDPPTPTPGPSNTGNWTRGLAETATPVQVKPASRVDGGGEGGDLVQHSENQIERPNSMLIPSTPAVAGTLMNAGLNAVPMATPPSNTHKPQEENHGWGSSSIERLPSPTPTSTPVFAAQKPDATDDSSARNSALTSGTINQVGNTLNAASIPNYAGPPNMIIHQNNIIANSPWNPSPNMQPPVPGNPGWGMITNQNPSPGWRAPSENHSAVWSAPPPNSNVGWVGPEQGHAALGWRAGPPTNPTAFQGTVPQGNINTGWAPPPVNGGRWENHQKNGGGRFSGHQDWSSQNGDPGRGGSRPSWNRQSSFGGRGGREGSSMPWIICKFHLSGHCKKGADCDLQHP